MREVLQIALVRAYTVYVCEYRKESKLIELLRIIATFFSLSITL